MRERFASRTFHASDGRLGPRLYALRDLRDERVAELGLRPDLARSCGLEVPRRRLPIDHAIARDLARALPGLQPAQHLSYVDHRQLPKAHRRLPAASRAVVGQHRALNLGRRARAPIRRVGVAP